MKGKTRCHSAWRSRARHYHEHRAALTPLWRIMMETPGRTSSLHPVFKGMDSPPSSTTTMSIDKLLPALLACFGIILCGYIAGRTNIITSTQAKGLGNFVSKFALPALLFKNMVLLDFSDVIWPFLWSILIAKVCVFSIVCVLTLIVASPDSRFSKAGLFSIFATQSNDFALGYPIVEALYRNTYPEYLQYIYLVAPVSLMILNPIGFAFCEIQKWKNQRNHQQSKLMIVGHVVLQVLKNPIVFMVVFGIAAHFVLHQTIPAFMAQFIDGLANSFGGSAQFYLGLTMVGQLRKLTKSTVVTLILLTTAKLLLMPLLCKDMVDLLDNNNSSPVNHSSLSDYAFLYGVFPSAPSVAIYAVYYNAELEVVTSGMVISTFLSAPIMYVSAWLLTIHWMDPQLLLYSLENVSFNISIVSLVALMLRRLCNFRKHSGPTPADEMDPNHHRLWKLHTVLFLLSQLWTITVMFLNKKFKRLPHVFTANLFLAQLLSCIGMILWKFVVKDDNVIGQILTFTLLCTSLYSTYIWPGLIALSIVLIKKFDNLNGSWGLLVIAGWGIPAIVTAILLITGHNTPDTIDSSLFYGRLQIICTTVVVGLGIVVGGGSLVCLSRGSWAQNDQDQDEYPSYDASPIEAEHQSLIEPENSARDGAIDKKSKKFEYILVSLSACLACDCVRASPMPDMIISTNTNNTPTPLTGQCENGCESTDCLLAELEELQQVTDRQTVRHVLLCLLLTVCLLANLSSCLWLLCNHSPGRLYLELQFFCAIANFGQGFISFAFFGLDKHFILLPLKRLYSWCFGKKKKEQPQPDLPDDIRMTCNQFIKYHKKMCFRDIVKKRRCGMKTKVDCFLGCELVDWLLKVGLAQDRGEALLYGTRLQQGGTLQHIKQEYSFEDGQLHYYFTT